MPAFFVHGVPETHRLWNEIRARIARRDVVAIDLPGFGSPAFPGFNATKEEYAEWLIGEVEKVGEPVDIVGHDWGSLLALRVASLRPELIRTWTAGGGAIHPDYVWHDLAQIWQTPGEGEAVMQGFTPEAIEIVLRESGVPDAAAGEMAAHVDETMKDVILKLYRSAVDVGREWDPALAEIPPKGLLIWGAEDPYMPLSYAVGMADRLGTRLVTLAHTGHWWPVEQADEVARLLEEHWESA